MIKLNNFDDIAKKYRDEILKLYKNQNTDYDTDAYGQQNVPVFPENDITEPQPVQDVTESFIMPDNDEIPNYSEPMYENYVRNEDMPPAVSGQTDMYNSNSASNMGTGFLQVKVTSGDGAYPIEDALVIITRTENGNENIIKILETNEDGTTAVIELPAPLENGTEISDRRPYSYYNIIVYAEGYYEVQNKNMAVFSGITSLQPVNLIPVPAYTEEKRVTTFYEQEPDL